MIGFRRFLKGILLKGVTSDPSDNLAGSLWYNSTSNKLKGYFDAAVRSFVSEDQAQTLTNKTIDADLNTLSNIENADIKTGAAIDAAKLADGSVSNTEFQYINSLTSNAQDQIDGANLAASNAQTAANDAQADIDNHISDAIDAHDASAISVVPAGNLAATQVQAALEELQGDIDNIDAANRTLSNLNTPTAINQSLLFDTDFTYDVGSQTEYLRYVYAGDTNTSNVFSWRGVSDFLQLAASGEIIALIPWNGLVAPTLQFYDKDYNNNVGIKAPDTLASTYVLTLPQNDGNSGEALTTDGSGVLSWSTVSSYTDEQAQDAVGGILDNGTIGDITFTYNDATPVISATIDNDSVLSAKIASSPILRGEVRRAATLSSAQSVYEEYTHSITILSSQTNTDIDALTELASEYDAMEITYRYKEDTTNYVRTGTFRVVTDGTNTQFNDSFIETNTTGLTFSAAINGLDIRIKYSTGANGGVLRTDVKRFVNVI